MRGNIYRLSLGIVCCVGLILVCVGCCNLGHTNRWHEEQIRIVVLKDFVSGRLGGDDQSPFKFFLFDVPSEYEASVLSQFFHNSKPPLIFDTNRLAIFREHAQAMDRIKGSRVIVFSASVDFLKFPEARATADSYTSCTGGDSYKYTLQFTNGEWRILTKEHGPMSKGLTEQIVASQLLHPL